jgi:hypothetical protein
MQVRSVVLWALLAFGCSRPREAEIRAAFTAANPDARVEDLTVGEGDDDHADYRIRFRVVGDTILREAHWLYVRQANGTWRNSHRGPAAPVAARP